MDYATIKEVTEKLIGNIEPVGETNIDEKIFANLENAIYLVEDYLYIISKMADRNSYEYSISKCEERCRVALKNFRCMIEEVS